MLYPSLDQRIGWCDTLIFAAIDHRISTESVQYIKRKLNVVDAWVSMELAKDHKWNRMSNDSYFNDAEEFNGYRGSDCPSVPSRCTKPMRDPYLSSGLIGFVGKSSQLDWNPVDCVNDS